MTDINPRAQARPWFLKYGKPAPNVIRMIITPEIAAEWIAQSSKFKNRPKKKSNSAKLIADVKDGNWVCNGETIILDTTRCVIQGQHRLDVVVQTGESIESYVVFGMPTNVFVTLDSGARRSTADAMQILQMDNNYGQSAAAKMIWGLVSQPQIAFNLRADLQITTTQTIRFRQATNIEYVKGTPHISPSILSAVKFLISWIAPDLVDEFMEGVITGVGLSATSPILVARERIINADARNERFNTEHKLHALLTGWNAFFEKRPIKSIKSQLDNVRHIAGLTEEMRSEIRNLFVSNVNRV